MRNWLRFIAIAAIATVLSPTASIAQEKKDDPVERVRIAAARVKSMNNLKQMAVAFHNNASAYQDKFPSDIVDKNGKALLSWRVAILPFIEEDNLYKQFKLDEPWDSEHNKKLLEKMPKIYAAPIGKTAAGHTFYQSFSGDGALMSGKPLKIGELPDGTSNTFMVVEAGESVAWTKPADVPFDAKKPLPKLGGIFDGAFNVALCDGAVRFVQKGADGEKLKKYITVGGGETTSEDDFKPAK